MNKLPFLSATAVSAILIFAGCSSSEDTEISPRSNEAIVSLEVQADAAASSRAISDGSGANKLFYRVFDKDGNIISDQLPLKQENASDLLTGHKVTLQLIKGQTYKIAFWAQNSACTAYSVDDNMNVTVDYSGANNDETRDAFFKTVDVAVTGEVKCGILTNREGTMKSGYVGGMVGRPMGTVNITNSKVWNTMIKANPGFRGKASIDEIVGDRTSKNNKTVSIDEATVNASTNEEANNMVIIL